MLKHLFELNASITITAIAPTRSLAPGPTVSPHTRVPRARLRLPRPKTCPPQANHPDAQTARPRQTSGTDSAPSLRPDRRDSKLTRKPYASMSPGRGPDHRLAAAGRPAVTAGPGPAARPEDAPPSAQPFPSHSQLESESRAVPLGAPATRSRARDGMLRALGPPPVTVPVPGPAALATARAG